MKTPQRFYPIGTPGLPWGAAELAQWRARQRRQRSCVEDVQCRVEALRHRFDVHSYGTVTYGDECFELLCVRSRNWVRNRPVVLVTGGVHGYETSGVLGALHFLEDHASRYEGRVNLLAVPCVSPWAYERVQRWNADAVDPNRSFRDSGTAPESTALIALVAPLREWFAAPSSAHIDLHETTDTDVSEFRPAKAARDGEAYKPCSVPDGFYLVDDEQNPQPAFQQAIIGAVQRVTHIAPADENGELIGSPVVAPGVISYPLRELGLCASLTGAHYTTTTEVYPDSSRTTPDECKRAQAAAVCAALDYVLTVQHGDSAA